MNLQLNIRRKKLPPAITRLDDMLTGSGNVVLIIPTHPCIFFFELGQDAPSKRATFPSHSF